MTETLKTFQTVSMDLEDWRLVDKVASDEKLTISDALSRLVRHGSIRYGQVVREQTVTLG